MNERAIRGSVGDGFYREVVGTFRKDVCPAAWGPPPQDPTEIELRTWAVAKIREGVEMRTKTGFAPSWLGRQKTAAHLLEELEERILKTQLGESAQRYNAGVRRRSGR